MKLPLTASSLWVATLVAVAQVALAADSTLDIISRGVSRVESVRQIKDLQRTFTQLAQYGKFSDMAGLFTETGQLWWGETHPVTDARPQVIHTGRDNIEAWLRSDSGDMDGVQPGSMHTLINETPVVTLSEDGKSAKGRWHSLRLQSNGKGATKIRGGMMVNEYVLADGKWKISLLRYHPLYSGDYAKGWKNVGDNLLPIVPFHYTPDEAGMTFALPLSQAVGSTARSENDTAKIEDLTYRIYRLNEEDEVRNLQNSYGYYLDRRMWTDTMDLFDDNCTLKIDDASWSGKAIIRATMEKNMGPEGLTRGVLNEFPFYDTIVELNPEGTEAIARGFEFGMTGDISKRAAHWDFSIFRNRFVKDTLTGIWKIRAIDRTHVMLAEYTAGWGNGGLLKNKKQPMPPFLDSTRPQTRPSQGWGTPSGRLSVSDTAPTNLTDLHRRLSRSSAYDETENVSGAYGYWADDIRCDKFAALHAQRGFKESPGVGFYFGVERIKQACLARYNTYDENPQRTNIPFHWRPQPVILVSHDGRSVTLRARILQTMTSRGGMSAFQGGMYHDQFVLEDMGGGVSVRRLWCLTIDEFYWSSSNWKGGWSRLDANLSVAEETTINQTAIEKVENRSPSWTSPLRRGSLSSRQIQNYPADVPLNDPKMVERETGFNGGPVKAVSWPNIQTMWWTYRNPVSGRVPQYYWPGCTPCRTAKPEWALLRNGYQEPPTGPSLATATASPVSNGTMLKVSVSIAVGPEEPVAGTVEVRQRGKDGVAVLGSAAVVNGKAELEVLNGDGLFVWYSGSDRLRAGGAVVKKA